MLRDADRPHSQALMVIRPARIEDAGDIARVHVDAWRITYRRIMPDDVLADLSYARREEGWRQGLDRPPTAGDSIFVAEDADRIVGFVAGGPERSGDAVYRGEVYAIYILGEYQGRGLGRRLMQAATEALVQASITTMLVWVLAANTGARGFYERLGGRVAREQLTEIAGQSYPEVGYGWNDLTALAAELGIQKL